ncbi:MAG: YdhR family protein [Spirochaetia bacterium]|nr:YdhR family protein [Spirochaetia bacterium]
MRKVLLGLVLLSAVGQTGGAEMVEPMCVTIVRIPIPWYAPKFAVKGKMKDSIAEYQAVPGLMAKYYTFGEDGTFGGIYLWRNKAAADAWFTPEWIAERSKKYNVSVSVPRYEVVSIIEGPPMLAVSTGNAYATLAPSKMGNSDSSVRTYIIRTDAKSLAQVQLLNAEPQNSAGVETFHVPIILMNAGK